MDKFKIESLDGTKTKPKKVVVSCSLSGDEAERFLMIEQKAKKLKVSKNDLVRQMVRFSMTHTDMDEKLETLQ